MTDIQEAATAEPFDEDMATRIDRHRLDRPTSWTVVEEPVDIGHALHLADENHAVVINCLTVWVATLLHRQYSEAGSPATSILGPSPGSRTGRSRQARLG